MTIALVDADLVAYRCAASCEPSKTRLELEPLSLAIARADELMNRILASTNASNYRAFLTGSSNFRKIIYPEYKANRKRTPLPEHLNDVREFLINDWKAEVSAGYEADDSIGIHAGENTVICSIDKDLRQIPGWHYHFVNDVFSEVQEPEAEYNYWQQVLTGDRSDNIIGIHGIGPAKAQKLLAFGDYLNVCKEAYKNANMTTLDLNMVLLRILRSETEYNHIMETIHENTIKEEQREESPKESSSEDSTEVS